MNNPRISKKDFGLIKAALRRAFARSDLHAKILNASNIEHVDPSRPKVKGWRRCAICGEPEAKSYMVVDHVEPLIPVNKTLHDLTVLEVVDGLWCEEKNLQSACPACHHNKTQSENKERRKNKRNKK